MAGLPLPSEVQIHPVMLLRTSTEGKTNTQGLADQTINLSLQLQDFAVAMVIRHIMIYSIISNVICFFNSTTVPHSILEATPTQF